MGCIQSKQMTEEKKLDSKEIRHIKGWTDESQAKQPTTGAISEEGPWVQGHSKVQIGNNGLVQYVW